MSSDTTFSESSAQDTRLAALEAKEWIEAVTGSKFKTDSFRQSLEDGVLLCELMKKVNPGFVRKINKSKSPIAYLDNIQQFLNGCQNLGMRDAQLFDTMDLQEIKGFKKGGVKRDEADRRIRGVCITLFWLGRTLAEMDSYEGPQLDLVLFKKLMDGNMSDEDDEEYVAETGYTNKIEAKRDYPTTNQLNHFQLETQSPTAPNPPSYLTTNHFQETESPTPTTTSNGSITISSPQENGLTLTFEQEQTADELLADIQNAVDEMLENFQFSPVDTEFPPSIPPPVSKKPNTETTREAAEKTAVERSRLDVLRKVTHVVQIRSRNGGFGFQVMGGMDSDIPAQVDYIVPGSAAEDSGLVVGDILVSVNAQNVDGFSHVDLVGEIKKAGWSGEVVIGVHRPADSNRTPQIIDYIGLEGDGDTSNGLNFSSQESRNKWEEENKERERQAQEIALMYPQRNGGENGVTNGPPPTYGRDPLPPLVEHHEEALFEQIQELMESSSPLAQQTRFETPPTSLQDDMQSIERELKELEQLEEATRQQSRDIYLSSESSGDEAPVSYQHVPKTVAADVTTIKFEVKESQSPIPVSPVPEIPLHVQIAHVEDDALSERRTPTPSPPPPLHPDDVPVTTPERREPEIYDELLNLVTTPLTSVANHPTEQLVTPPPMFGAPPSKEKKRVVKRPAPPPPKPRENKNASYVSRDQNTPETWMDTVPVANDSENDLPTVPISSSKRDVSSPRYTPSPQEHVAWNSTSPHEILPRTASSPYEEPFHTTPSPHEEPYHTTPSPHEILLRTAYSPYEEPFHTTPSPHDIPSPQGVPSPHTAASPQHNPTPQPDLSPVELLSPLFNSITIRSDSPDLVTQMQELAYSKGISNTLTDSFMFPASSSSIQPASTATTTTSTTTPIQNNTYSTKQQTGPPLGWNNMQINGSSKPRGVLNSTQQQVNYQSNRPLSMDSDTPAGPLGAVVARPISTAASATETVEMVGGIKIQRVQKTRWMPRANSTEPSTPDHTVPTGSVEPSTLPNVYHNEKPSHAPDHTVPVLSGQHLRDNRSATLPSSYLHKKQQINSYEGGRTEPDGPGEKRRQDPIGGPVVVAKGIGGMRGIGIGQERKKNMEQPQQVPQRSVNPYQPVQQKQPWRSQEELRNQRIHPNTRQQKNATTPDGTKSFAVQPQGNNSSKPSPEDWRKNRSKTWSGAAADASRDGYQVAYAIQPKSPYDLCSRCHQPLGQEIILSLPNLRTQYHSKCFVCRVCRGPIGFKGQTMTIMVKNKQPHCKFCASNEGGMVTTEC